MTVNGMKDSQKITLTIAQLRKLVSESKKDFTVVAGKLYTYTGTDSIELNIPRGVVEITDYLFWRKDFRYVRFPSSLKKIGSGCFEGCPNLIEVSLPMGMETVEEMAFANCDDLSFVELGGTSRLGQRAFSRCRKLLGIEIPSSIETIEKETFYGCQMLNSVELHYGTRVIGEGAFRDCRSLEEIIIPDSVEKIEKDAFSGCDNLDYVTLPRKLDEEYQMNPAKMLEVFRGSKFADTWI